VPQQLIRRLPSLRIPSRRSRNQPAHGASQIAPRRLAVDALRGFCLWGMFLQDGLVGTLQRLPASSTWATFLGPFTHAQWNGFHLADANMPAFIALIGTSMMLSYHNRRRQGATKRAYFFKVSKRFLFMLAFAAYFQHYEQVGFFFDLAFCILFSGMLMLSLTPRALVVTLIALLLAQWAVMAWLPVPGHGAGDYAPQANAATYVQSISASAISAVLGLKAQHYGMAQRIAWNAVFPTKLASCIIGLILGYILLSDIPYRKQALLIDGLGGLAMALGGAWDAWCPLNKHLWTPSYSLFAAGLLFLFLAAFIQICEVWKCRKLVWIFSWIGQSPLLAVFWFASVPMLDDIAERLADVVVSTNFVGQPLVVRAIQIALAVPCFAISRQWSGSAADSHIGRRPGTPSLYNCQSD
jgi:predicted acyltransferase